MENIQIVVLEPWQWKQYKDLRLRALKENPESFSSTYEENIKHPDEFWMEKLQDVKEGNQWLIFARKDLKLVGMVGAFIEGSKDTAIIIAMYVPIEERGQGISKKLMEAIIEKVKENKTIKKLNLRVSTGQPVALNLYKSFGFKEFKKEKIVLGDGEERMICYLERLIN